MLFKREGHRLSPRFYLLISDVDHQQNKGAGKVQDYLA